MITSTTYTAQTDSMSVVGRRLASTLSPSLSAPVLAWGRCCYGPHFYRYGYAVSYNPTKDVEEMLKLPRSTAGRWIAAAREAGYLGPSDGMGKAGG